MRPCDEFQNGDMVIEDTYEKINADITLLTDKLIDVKREMKDIPWYRFGTRIKLRKELSCIEKESDKIAERLKKLDRKKTSPIQIIKRV